MKRNRDRVSLTSSWVRDMIFVTIGAFLTALSVNWVFVPNQIVTGGLTGIGILLEFALGIPISATTLLLNIPLFVAGWKMLGGQAFGFKTLYGFVVLAGFIQLTDFFRTTPLTDEPLLACIYGGVLLGGGLGIVFRGRATTGGTDLLARLVQKLTGVSPGVLLLVIDGLIIVSAAVMFNVERILYALVSLFVTGKTIDFIQEGLARSKVAYIISAHHDQIKEGILHSLDRGVTQLEAVGGYTGENRKVLLCVVNQSEVSNLKDLVRSVDSEAFVIVSDAHEVLGKGFLLPTL
ncbi:YitT family protein [Effusibacillus consociatus]|uniref:YitT family protein n=1 Tax=Effusibacillus consociatus TaxID=1117041 RepID=A0ABV9Q3F6_9BACL